MLDLDAVLRDRVDSMDSGSNNPEAAHFANALRDLLNLADLLDNNGNPLLGAVADEIRTRTARELGVSA